jgi:glycogen debranching enzyme
VAGLVPLVLPGLPGAVAAELVDRLLGPGFGPDGVAEWLLPSYDRDGPAFDPRRYWRGPAWVSTTWLVWRGLLQHGYDDVAGDLAKPLLRAVAREGFREYFNPVTGAGCGVHELSWSAALVLDLLRDRSVLTGHRPR